MPSRKQRRRRQKERRHEYEFVYVDEEGREVEVDPDELEAARPRASRQDGKGNARQGQGARNSRIRAPSSLATVRRSSGSNVKRVPGRASSDSPPESTRTDPSTTSTNACSFTWCSPSSWPGSRPIRTARAASSESST